ncbi:hypothetical protein FACS189487_01390 [Campylobacterota bacterium]|nr:hypothetical protein FACS189487_01390 [Campylobacterota bacterium]
MRIFALILLLAASALAYKDAFYLGYYGAAFDGKLDMNDQELDIKNDGFSHGFRLGWNDNMRSHFLAKIRWELFYEDRSFTFNGSRDPINGWHGGASFALGWNTDLFLTQELVPYIKLGAGAGEFNREIGHGTNMQLGVGLAFALKYLEITIEAKREFWQLKGYRFPLKAPFSGDGDIDIFSAGINIKF